MRRWAPVLLLAIAGGGALHAQFAPINCSAASGGNPVIAGEGISALVADVIVTCTGGAPTPSGQNIPAFNFTVSLNVGITSRLLAIDWSDALLLLDEPPPTAQFPCDQASGICPGFGNGLGAGYYGGGTQTPNSPNNRNVFQSPLPAGNSITWQQIPVDPPGVNRRTFRFTNLRVNATQLGPGAFVTANVSAGQLPIAGSPVSLAIAQSTLSATVRDGPNATATPNGVPVPINIAANTVRLATLRFAEIVASAAKTRTAAAFVNVDTSPPPVNQNTPGASPNTETGFFNNTFGTYGARGNLGLAGLADSGSRFRAAITNIPAGVSVFVDIYNSSATTGPSARLISTDASGAGAFSAVPGATTAQLNVVNGTATAVWEVLRADPAQLDAFNFGVYLSYAANFAAAPPPAVTAQLTYAPQSTVVGPSATAPVPRFVAPAGSQTLFTFFLAPALTSLPANLSFTATVGGPDPAPQNLALGSTGAALNLTLTTGGAIPITLTPATGSTPLNVSVAVSSKGLAAGRYPDRITVTAQGAVNSPFVIPVDLTVGAGTPTISALNPAAVTAGGPPFTLTITGTFFAAGATVQVGSANLIPTSLTPNSLTVNVPQSLIVSPGTLPVNVTNPGGFVSNILNLTVSPQPVITSLSPSVVNAGGPAFTLTINGTGFVPGATVQIAGTTYTVAGVTATQITVFLPATLITQPQTLQVTVTNPGGAVSNSVPLTITRFSVTSISPSSVTATRPAFVLTINGVGFVTGASVQVGPTALTPDSLSATQITVNVPASVVAQPRILGVSVTNPGGVVSNSVDLTVNPAPAITALDPASATAGGAAFTLTVNGTAFFAGAVVQWNGQSLATTLVSATRLTAQVPANLIATGATAAVTVLTADGVSSPRANFTVTGGMPTISTLGINSVTIGSQNVTLIVNGTGFVAGSVVVIQRAGGAPVTLTPDSVTPTQITTHLPDNLLAQPGDLTIRVMNPGGLTSGPATLSISLPALPAVSFTGPASSESAQDQQISVGLAGAYPVDLQGRLTLTFTPDGNLPNDPAIQFQNNLRTFDFTVTAGTQAVSQVTLKTGTTTGMITVTPSYTVGANNLTPPGVATLRIQIARAAPVISFIDCVRISATTINVIIDGHTNTRAATQATFDLQAAAGANLATSQLQASVAPLFTGFFGGSPPPAASANVGGNYRYTQTLIAQGNAADVGMVTGRVANDVGTSAPRSASCHAQ